MVVFPPHPSGVLAEPRHQTTLVNLGPRSASDESNFGALHQRIKSKRFHGENCKTEANFYGCLVPTIFPMDARTPKYPRIADADTGLILRRPGLMQLARNAPRLRTEKIASGVSKVMRLAPGTR